MIEPLSFATGALDYCRASGAHLDNTPEVESISASEDGDAPDYADGQSALGLFFAHLKSCGCEAVRQAKKRQLLTGCGTRPRFEQPAPVGDSPEFWIPTKLVQIEGEAVAALRRAWLSGSEHQARAEVMGIDPWQCEVGRVDLGDTLEFPLYWMDYSTRGKYHRLGVLQAKHHRWLSPLYREDWPYKSNISGRVLNITGLDKGGDAIYPNIGINVALRLDRALTERTDGNAS